MDARLTLPKCFRSAHESRSMRCSTGRHLAIWNLKTAVGFPRVA